MELKDVNLTPEQKLEGYKFALEKIKERGTKMEYDPQSSPYVCDNLSFWLQNNEIPDVNSSFSTDKLKKHFPEFMAKEPETDNDMGWWPIDYSGKRARIGVLTRIIKKLEK